MFKIFINKNKQNIIHELQSVEELKNYISSSERTEISSIKMLRKHNTEGIVSRIENELPICNFKYIFPVLENHHSGYWYYKVNNKTDFDYDVTHVSAFWKSADDKGYCLLVKVENIPNDKYDEIYKRVAEELCIPTQDYLSTVSMEADYVSYDAGAYYNADVTALSFETKELENKLDLQPDFYPQSDNNIYNYYRNGDKIKSSNLDDVLTKYNIVYNEDGLFDAGSDKIKYCNCYVPLKYTDDNKRYRYLDGFSKCIISLNPNVNYSNFHSFIAGYNRKYFFIPFDDKIVEEITTKNYKLKGTINPQNNAERRFIYQDPNITTNTKKTLNNIAIGNDRAEKTRHEFLEYLINWDYEKYPKITQKNLQEVSGRNKKTVNTHYRIVRNRFKEINEAINKKSGNLSSP